MLLLAKNPFKILRILLKLPESDEILLHDAVFIFIKIHSTSSRLDLVFIEHSLRVTKT